MRRLVAPLLPFCVKLFRMNLGQRIQECRKKRGLSQEALADVLSVSRQAVQKWESGSSTPELEKLTQIADYFGVSLDYLVKGIDSQNLDTGKVKSPSTKYAVGTTLFSIAVAVCIITCLTCLGIFLYQIISYNIAVERAPQGPVGNWFLMSEVNERVIEFAAQQGRQGLTVNDADFIPWKDSLLLLYYLDGTTYWYKPYPRFDESVYWLLLPMIASALPIPPCIYFQVKCIRKWKALQPTK